MMDIPFSFLTGLAAVESLATLASGGGCHGVLLVIVLTIAPLAIEAVPLPYLVISNETYVDDSTLLRVVNTATGVASTLAGDSVSAATNLVVQTNFANDTENAREDDLYPSKQEPLSHSVVASIIIVLIISLTFLVSLYMWREYYPPRPHREQTAQPSEYPLPNGEQSVLSKTTSSRLDIEVVAAPSAAHIRNSEPWQRTPRL